MTKQLNSIFDVDIVRVRPNRFKTSVCPKGRIVDQRESVGQSNTMRSLGRSFFMVRKNRDHLIGQTFGILTITEILPHIPYKNRRCMALCGCGVSKKFEINNLIRGFQWHCGRDTHGVIRPVKHGLSTTRIYKAYTGMIGRCYNADIDNYHNYGARGITVCDEWRNDPMAFYIWSIGHGYQDDLTLERKDVNGNYSPGNCKWATTKEQQNNKRSNVLITYNGETKTVTHWADELGYDSRMLFLRIKRGWTVEEMLTIPKRIWPSQRMKNRV